MDEFIKEFEKYLEDEKTKKYFDGLYAQKDLERAFEKFMSELGDSNETK
jgi:hypothetical protein